MGIPRPGLLVDRIKSTVSLGLNGALNGIVHIQWYNYTYIYIYIIIYATIYYIYKNTLPHISTFGLDKVILVIKWL